MWILDGYNLLFRIPNLRGSLEARREHLIATLIEKFPRRAMIIVFDGRIPPPDHERRHVAHVEVVYTAAGMTADSWIVDRIQGNSHPHRIHVVTGDRGLGRLVSCCGARVEEPDLWIGALTQQEPLLPRVRLGRSAMEYQEVFQNRLERLLRGEDLED